MAISTNINEYIKNSVINGKVCRFRKHDISIYISKILASIPETKKNDYYGLVDRAISIWNRYSSGLFRFNVVNLPQSADITIVWTKVGIKYEGMCKFKSIVNSEFRSVLIEIGLPNPNSPKITNDSTIMHVILHELGHALGLGHGVREDDLMFVPHTKTLDKPGENDLYVLGMLYGKEIGSSF